MKDPIRANDQITCVSLLPGSTTTVAVGTSFHGFFETTDGGRKWVSLSEPLTPLKLGGGNYEEIASLAYQPDAPSRIWFALGFGKGLFAYTKGGKTVDRWISRRTRAILPIRSISFNRHSAQEDWYLEALTD